MPTGTWSRVTSHRDTRLALVRRARQAPCPQLCCAWRGMDREGWMQRDGCKWMDADEWMQRHGCEGIDVEGGMQWEGCTELDAEGWIQRDGKRGTDADGWMQWDGYSGRDGFKGMDAQGWIALSSPALFTGTHSTSCCPQPRASVQRGKSASCRGMAEQCHAEPEPVPGLCHSSI